MSFTGKLLVFIAFYNLLSVYFFCANAFQNITFENGSTGYNFLVTGGYRPFEATLTKYIVSIRTSKYTMFFGDNHFCGGSIISQKVILTAAHCLCIPNTRMRRPAADLLVVAGTPKRLEASKSTQLLQVKKVLRHKYYKVGSFRNDIGLIILSDGIIEDGVTVQRINLPTSSALPYAECTVVGWGTVYYMGPLPNEALYANIQIFDKSYCKLKHKNFAYGMLCAGNKADHESDSCSGDSGGPLICNGVVTGIVSFGEGCGFPGNPGYYSDVASYVGWIRSNECSKLWPSQRVLQIVQIIIVASNF